MHEKLALIGKWKLVLYSMAILWMIFSFFVGVFFGRCAGFMAARISYTLFLLSTLLYMRKGLGTFMKASPANAFIVLSWLFTLVVAWVFLRC